MNHLLFNSKLISALCSPGCGKITTSLVSFQLDYQSFIFNLKYQSIHIEVFVLYRVNPKILDIVSAGSFPYLPFLPK